MITKASILVVDDEEGLRFTFQDFLSGEGYSVRTAEDFESAVALLDGIEFDLVFADIILGEKTGIDLLREVRRRELRCPVIMVTGYPNVETAAEAVRLGAFDYIPKPVRQHTLLQVTRLALKHIAMEEEKERYRAHFEAIFRSVTDGIITVDEDLTVIDMNDAVRTVCGLQRDSSLGRKFFALAHSCNDKCTQVVRETIARRKPLEISRHQCVNALGERTVVTVRTAPLEGPDGVSGAVIVLRDETRLAGLEEELDNRGRFGKMLGESREMQRLFNMIEDLADLDTTVLVTGESGTGKELVAQALHNAGDRRDRKLVKVNCAALAETLLETELFGHVKGAFTGAVRNQEGRFKRADGGTLFLDEIGDISPSVQLKLLRVLQEKEFERVGDSSPVQVDVRIIAATNQNLKEKMNAGSFREDLYYRLNVVEIRVPPLRERPADIPVLIHHFVERFNRTLKRDVVAVTPEVERLFLDYWWPGNVRELEHVIEHCCVVCRESRIGVEHLPRDFIANIRNAETEDGSSERGVSVAALRQALENTDWNKAKAARLLGVSRMTVYRKMEEYQLERDVQGREG